MDQFYPATSSDGSTVRYETSPAEAGSAPFGPSLGKAPSTHPPSGSQLSASSCLPSTGSSIYPSSRNGSYPHARSPSAAHAFTPSCFSSLHSPPVLQEDNELGLSTQTQQNDATIDPSLPGEPLSHFNHTSHNNNNNDGNDHNNNPQNHFLDPFSSSSADYSQQLHDHHPSHAFESNAYLNDSLHQYQPFARPQPLSDPDYSLESSDAYPHHLPHQEQEHEHQVQHHDSPSGDSSSAASSSSYTDRGALLVNDPDETDSQPPLVRPTFTKAQAGLELNVDQDPANLDASCFPTSDAFDVMTAAYLENLAPRKRMKALIDQELYDKALTVLMDPRQTTTTTAQFRFWTKKMFKLVEFNGEFVVTHEGRPVAVKEQIYDVLV